MHILVEKINYENDILSISFQESIHGTITIKRRKSLDDTNIYNIEGTEVLIPIDTLKLDDSGKQFFDIFFKKDDKELRLRLFDRDKLQDSMRFPFVYKLDSRINALPYISKDGYICIMQNNHIHLLEQGKVNIRPNIIGDTFCVRVENESIVRNTSEFDSIIYLKNDQTKDIVTIDNENLSIFFKSNNIPIGNYKFYILFFNKKLFYEMRICAENEFNDFRHSLLKIEDRGKSYKVSVEKNGMLTLDVKDSLTSYIEEITPQVTECLYESYELNDNELIFTFKNVDFSENSYEFWLYNYNGSFRIRENIVEDRKIKFVLDEDFLSFIEQVSSAELMILEKSDEEIRKIMVMPISIFYVDRKINLGKDVLLLLESDKIKLEKNSFEDESIDELYVVEKNFSIKNLSMEKSSVHFEITNLDNIEKVNIYYLDRTTKEQYPIKIQQRESEFIIDLDTFCESLDFSTIRADIIAEVEINNLLVRGKLQLTNTTIKEKFKRYFYNIECPSHKKELNNRNNILMFFLTKNNELSFVIRDKKFIYSEKYELSVSLSDCSLIENGLLKITSRIELKTDIELENIKTILVLKSKIKDIALDMVEERLDIINHSITYSSYLNMLDVELEQFYYEAYIQAEIDDVQIYTRITNSDKRLKERLNYSTDKNSIIKDGNLVYPFITNRNVLYIAYRENISDDFNKWLKNERRAEKFYKQYKYQLDAQKIWLIYEKESETAQDNSFYFFKYCYENHKEKNVYYIIKKDSPDKDQLKGMEDRVLEFMSFKHLVYLQAAQLLVASETRGHAYVWRYQKGRIREILDNKPFVFLQHGVTAFKLNDSVLRKDSPTAVDVYITTSEFERDIIKNGLGYDDSDILITGFPRWDNLKDTSKKLTKRKILVMPTWRSWLDEVPDEEFVQNEYYLRYTELLTSKRLENLAKSNNLEVDFLLHPKFKQYISTFTIYSEYINLVSFGDKQVNDILMESSLLITDYSSVAWEMYYMEKPTIFFQFDYEKYIELTGSYIDMNELIFGERVFDVNNVLTTLEKYLKNGFEEMEKYQDMRTLFFQFEDTNNSKRVYDEILLSKFYKKLNDKKYNNKPLPNRVKLFILSLINMI